jgi:hypothetical protein
MATATRNDPIFERFRAAVREIYGDRLERIILYRLERIILFGSRARRRGAGFRLRRGGVSARHAALTGLRDRLPIFSTFSTGWRSAARPSARSAKAGPTPRRRMAA